MPKVAGEIGFEHKGIGNVLAHSRLRVPLNQREYSWEVEHVQDLLGDFANALATNRGSYFLGSIVLTKGQSDVPEVSDGQQRLATTSILLAAIRDYFFRANDTARAASIESDFLTTIDIKTTNIVPKLRLNVDDNEYFVNRVLASPEAPERKLADPSKESHRRIMDAAELAARYVQDLIRPYSDQDKTARLLDWVEFVREGAQVIVLRVPDHLNAFMMFETLNDRGLRASQADLLKNYLLSFADDRIEEAQNKWAQMVGVLDSLGQGDITVTYLHHVLITRQGPMKEREVFDKVKSSVTSQNQALEFLSELAEGVNDYTALFSADHSKWNGYGTSTRKHITTINRELRVQQIKPLMFAVARKFSVTEAKIAFRLFVFWSVRFLFVGGGGGLLDRNYAQRAQEVGTGKIKTAADLAKALSTILPSDASFEASFASAPRIAQGYFARYLLRALERKVKQEAEPEWIPNDEEETINLEHILPESPGVNWPNISPEEAAANYRRLGNMVIMQAKKNSMIGNSTFDDKKVFLGQSTFILTAEVATSDTWGMSEIVTRQQRLAKLAVDTWPLTI